MSISRIIHTLRAVRDEERGVALATVLIFMLAGVVLSLVVASTVLYSYSFSSATRANVQAQAAAEAGIAEARAGLLNGTCTDHNGHYTGSDPEYSVWVYKEDVAGTYEAAGSTWSKGCPSVSQQALLIADGVAATKGTGRDSTGDAASVEALLSAAGAQTGLTASGPAIFAYSASGFTGSGTISSTSLGGTPDVMLRTGDVDCRGHADGAVQLVVKSGNFTGGGSCAVEGDLWVNGDVTLNGGASVNGTITGRNVTVAAERIGGNVWADETFTGKWSTPIAGWVSAKTVKVEGSTITGDVWARSGATTVAGGAINGAVHANGSFRISNGTARGGQVTGEFCRSGGTVTGPLTVSRYASGCSTVAGVSVGTPLLPPSPTKPTAILVPEWIDFGVLPENAEEYTGEFWGATLVKMTGTCQNTQFQAALNAIGDAPGLIDARGCNSSGLVINGGTAFSVKDDLTIIANKFTTGGSVSLNAPSASNPSRLWLITPDLVKNKKPDCPAGEYVSAWNSSGRTLFLNGDFSFNNLNTMIYSPCVVVLGEGNEITGQLFVKGVAIEGDATLDYRPVGIPGYNLDTGEPAGEPATEWDRQIVSQRNITG